MAKINPDETYEKPETGTDVEAQPLTAETVANLISERRAEPPTNFHHAAAAMVVSSSVDIKKRVVMLAGTSFLAVAQLVVLICVTLSMTMPSCSGNDDCVVGYFCRINERTTRCAPCQTPGYCSGEADIIDLSEESCMAGKSSKNHCWQLASVEADDRWYVSERDYANHCNACANVLDEETAAAIAEAARLKAAAEEAGLDWSDDSEVYVDETLKDGYLTAEEALSTRTDRVRIPDILVLIFCSFFVGASLANEQRDTQLCAIQQRQRLGPGDRFSNACLTRALLWIVDAIRRFGVAPILTLSVVLLTSHRGADSLNICLNSVAVLLLLEVDDAIYAHVPTADIRDWCEKHARTTVSDAEQQMIDWAKYATITSVMTIIPVAVTNWSKMDPNNREIIVMLVTAVPCLLAQAWAMRSARGSCKGLAELLLEFLIGFGLAIFLYYVAFAISD